MSRRDAYEPVEQIVIDVLTPPHYDAPESVHETYRAHCRNIAMLIAATPKKGPFCPPVRLAIGTQLKIYLAVVGLGDSAGS